MPPEPPVVTANGIELAPLAVHWIVADEVVRSIPADEESIEVAQVPVRGPITFTIGHPTVAPTLCVEVFEGLDERLHPTGPGRTILCTPESGECQVQGSEGGLQVDVALEPVDVRLAVLQVAYTVWPDVAERVDGAPALLTAS